MTHNIIQTPTLVDFTNIPSVTQGGINALTLLSNGKYALYAGDFDDNGQTQNADIITTSDLIGASGYSNADMDMNAQTQNADIGTVIAPCIGKGKQF